MTEGPYTCQQIVDDVTEYLDDGLGTTERVAFERHVAICPPCRGYLSQMRKVTQVAGRIRQEDLSPEMRDGLLRAFSDWKKAR